jgi:guanosine-3',5'-bis(diphosphate) 3'-pyrophosphohydrolase
MPIKQVLTDQRIPLDAKIGALRGKQGEGWMETKTDLGAVLMAASFAAEKHRDQRRKDAEASPYINHPIALANVLANEGHVIDPDVLCAALLHDTIEDTETTADELRMIFGDAVTGIVLEVTDDKSLPKAERKRLQIEHAAHASPKAKLVKLADKICNLRDILSSPPADWSVARKREYFDWSAEVVVGVRDVHPGLASIFDQLLNQRPA